MVQMVETAIWPACVKDLRKTPFATKQFAASSALASEACGLCSEGGRPTRPSWRRPTS